MTHSARSLKALVLTAALVLPGLAFAADPAMADKNGMMTDHKGMTLYTFDKDDAFKSHCEGGCLKAWPAYGAEAPAGASVHTAAKQFTQGGAQQWAWNGKPLYYFAGDAKPGDVNGDGSGGVWHVIRPATKAAAAPHQAVGYGY